MAGLEVQLQAPTETELNPPPVEDPHQDAAKQQLQKEINQLRERKNRLKREIGQYSQKLGEKKEELTELEVELEAPTKAELNDATPTKQSKWSLVFPFFVTVALLGLLVYLFIFYASAGDKAFSSGRGSSVQQQLNEIVNHAALFQAWQEGNWFVFTFPFIFLVLAIVTHHFFSDKKWWLFGIVLVITFSLDGVIAIKISQRIHDDKMLRGLLEETEQWTTYDLNIFAVLLLGFVVSLLLSCGFYCTHELWKRWGHAGTHRTEQDIRDKKIKNEKTQREARIAVLKSQIENLHSEIDKHPEKVAATQQTIEDYETKIGDLSRQQLEKKRKAAKMPIETQISVLKAEMENLQNEIDQLNSKNTAIQQAIEKIDVKIEACLRQDKRVVDEKKIESQVNQFLNGWCRFVAHSGNGTTDTDVSPQIVKVMQVADKTLNQYYEGLQGDSSQS